VEQLPSESLNSTLANKQLELKVLREHIKAAERQLASLKAEVPKAETKLKILSDDLRALGLEKPRILKDIARVKKQLELAVNEKNQAESLYKAQKRQFDIEVSGRKDYLGEQEELINTAVERGNEELKIIRYQIEELAESKQEVENNIYDSKQILEQLGRTISNEAINLGAVQEANKAEQEEASSKLREIQDKIGNAKLKLQAITEETDNKFSILRGKEESIIARENAIRIQKEDLARRERRLNSAERLYM